MTESKQSTVAVIGCGGQGLVTVKNLLEEGYNVTGFEKNDYVGGIWHYSAEHRVSALPTTVVNISRERACFTDFPFPDREGSYPTSAEMDRYLNDYADHFNLRPHIRLSTTVTQIQHNDADDTWQITVQSNGTNASQPEILSIQKLVMAVGPHSKPIESNIHNRELFAGEIIHSLSFKDPQLFKDKRVLIIGVSNSAADTATSLLGHASKIYLAHRHGCVVLPRILKTGASLDHSLSYRQFNIKDGLDAYTPALSRRFMDNIVSKISQSEFGTLDPSWRLTPAPSLLHQVPTVSDMLVPALREGNITSTAAPRRIVDDGTGTTIELQDGSTVAADVIVQCTGYNPDFSILGPYDPTLRTDGTHEWPTPSLYQNIISLQYPNSLAFIGIAIVLFPAFLLSDLSSMALAQLWSRKPGSPDLPPQSEMQAWYESHLRWVESIQAMSPDRKYVKYTVQNGPWLQWIDQMTGANLDRNLGYRSLDAWRLWWNDRQFSRIVIDGVWSPHIYRLFDSGGRRKKWDGARDAVIKVNEDVTIGKEKRRKEREVKEAKAETGESVRS